MKLLITCFLFPLILNLEEEVNISQIQDGRLVSSLLVRYSSDKLGILQTDSVKVVKSPVCMCNSFKSKSPIDSGRVVRLCL